MDLDRTNSRFATTRWTLLDALHGGDDADYHRASEELSRVYWPPVYRFLRALRHPPERAADLTQAFFTDVVLRRRLFDRAERQSGRLRTLILTALKRFLVDQHRRLEARPEGRAISLTDHEREDLLHPIDPESSPGTAFQRRWSVATLEEALRRAEHHYRSSGRSGHWSLFEARVLHPSVRGTVPTPFTEAAAQFGFKSAADAAAAVQTVKKRFINVIREVIAETTVDPRDIEEEYQSLVSTLLRRP